MKKNLQLTLNTFWISAMLNTAVVTPHILTAKEFELNESVSIFLLVAGISVSIFAASSVVVYVFASLFAKMNREKSFWILMLIGIAIAVLSDHIFSNSLAKYNNQTGWISAIAGFSIMCALASQYQLFLGQSQNKDKAFA